MNFQNIIPDQSIQLFVKNIWIFESSKNLQTSIPFFADGYPGLMFQQTKNGLIVNPHQMKMPEIFLYGQTIKPISLEIKGAYQIIIFQFYPFVLRAFWEIIPESINDSCYYLEDTTRYKINLLVSELNSTSSLDEKIKIITDLLLHYFKQKKDNLDLTIRKTIQAIINEKGQISIKELVKNENLHIRTFERRFSKETGLTPKQFSKIIQFQASLQQLTAKDYKKLTDIVYENGFSDQSHFIRVFKAFTGKTPKSFTIN